MELQLRPARPSDHADIVATIFSAFETHPIHARLFPRDLGASHEFWESYVSKELQDPNARFIIAEDVSSTSASPSSDNLTTSTFVAFALWKPPVTENSSLTSAPAPPPDWSAWPANPALAAAFFGAIGGKHTTIMGDRLHFYLELICCRPEFMGNGAGGLMMRWGLEQADAGGFETYLDATPSGKPLYDKNGFRTLEVVKYLDGACEHYFMIRDPKTAAEKSTCTTL
ncbi:acyl-CoA N-acyltransferase [Podospora didyma]|uniref:Acyl-CoA N-acyltransferase n=1 Tax=Podospora didyma TaxID=330526 RepID=A0AAE0N533_9PEZI|nr:acyl-CoA N-acyltransferase [Podospora didyma]